ncbi:hypothetical protein BGZ70_009443 [Mortierella alpina]|uniref:Uncharacterized protein n=1 Tax=Mortierella alpina TaxID=64518 RepID=A0A9P6M0Q5_MORAP|nr:hypothetical protein BGZ70_009443 [Mortierella alpina]
MKSSILAFVAVAVAMAASADAQAFTPDTCSACTFTSVPKEPKCASLTPEKTGTLMNAFANSAVNVTALAIAVMDPEIHACVCNWGTNTFNTTGAASFCATKQGSEIAPACSEEQILIATTKMAPLAKMLQCPSASSTNTTAGPPGGAGAPGTPGAPTSTKPSAASSLTFNVPYVAMTVAFGLAAFAGL